VAVIVVGNLLILSSAERKGGVGRMGRFSACFFERNNPQSAE
jgi:hypothetical protein